MNMFKEVADIKTSDQLHLPVPEARFETVVVQPSEYQKDMVASVTGIWSLQIQRARPTNFVAPCVPSFAALTGYDAAVKETARLTEDWVEF